MQNELQILDLVMQASWLVKGVMLLLLLASVASALKTVGSPFISRSATT